MPNKDGTGPKGQGPKDGQGKGKGKGNPDFIAKTSNINKPSSKPKPI